MEVSVKADVAEVRRYMSVLHRRQIPYATSVAINETLFDARKVEIDRLEADLDRPTPWTKRGLFVRKADKESLRGILEVRPNQASYLIYQIEGGTRTPRGRALTVPPVKTVNGNAGVRLDRYGNIPRSQKAKALLAKPDTFSATIRGVAGIWQRARVTKSGKVTRPMRLLLAYAHKATYQPRWRFHRYAEDTVDRKFKGNFDRALAAAIRSAK